MDADRTVEKEEARRKIVAAMFRKIMEEAQARPQKYEPKGLLAPIGVVKNYPMATRG